MDVDASDRAGLENDPSDFEVDGSEPAALSDSDVVFDLVERLVARGYRVRVAIDMPGGNRVTLTGAPADGG